MSFRGEHAGASPHWEKMWSGGLGKGQAFDVGAPSQTLVAELARTQYATRPGLSALVPGCGRAYDAVALAQHGFDSVVAMDIAPTACKAAELELQSIVQSTSASQSVANVQVRCGDFFTFDGEFDLIWDCTFLCALDPSVREQWASQMHKLLKPGGVLLTCIFPISDSMRGGPPFPMSVPLVRGLLEPVGFRPIYEQDELPLAAQHRPGGGLRAGGAGPRTALVAWQSTESPASAI